MYMCLYMNALRERARIGNVLTYMLGLSSLSVGGPEDLRQGHPVQKVSPWGA